MSNSFICVSCLRTSRRLPASLSSLNTAATRRRAHHPTPSTATVAQFHNSTRRTPRRLAHDINKTRLSSRWITTSSPFHHPETTSIESPTTTTRTTSTSHPPPQNPSSSTTTPMPTATTTKAILNPRIDEDGQPMTIEITPRASRRLSEIMNKEKNASLHLRITVESGGCHGFQYLMSLTSSVDAEEDTVFVAASPQEDGDGGKAGVGWEEMSCGRAKVVMDEASLELLKGSKIDYTMELIGSQFKIVDNPRASSSCGCGTSFDVKV